MNPFILNRNFQHPADGWYHIEPKGEHPNPAGRVVQVIDDAACAAMVNRFNQDADAGRLSHGPEMLIDHEHFKHDAARETIAYGWLQRLAYRADGVYGQIRWSATGQKAVDGGDYRFFSTEYEPEDLQACGEPPQAMEGISDRSSTDPVARVRPLRLAGLTLTNDPNNKGARPITNRGGAAAPPRHHDNFAGAGAPAGKPRIGTSQNQNQGHQMKSVCTLLGLSAEADEQSVLAEVTRLQNRIATLEPLAAENLTLKNRVNELDASNVDSLLAAHGVKEARVLNRMKSILLATPVADRQACLDELIPAARVEAPIAAAQQNRLYNRDTKPPGGGKVPEGNSAADSFKATNIMNRARELKRQTPNLTAATAVIMAQREMENQ